MSGIVDPSTPEREARKEAEKYLLTLDYTGREHKRKVLDRYAAAVRARALADVAGWVDDVRGTMPGIGKRPDEVSNDAFYETRGMERACGALLAKLREAK